MSPQLDVTQTKVLFSGEKPAANIKDSTGELSKYTSGKVEITVMIQSSNSDDVPDTVTFSYKFSNFPAGLLQLDAKFPEFGLLEKIFNNPFTVAVFSPSSSGVSAYDLEEYMNTLIQQYDKAAYEDAKRLIQMDADLYANRFLQEVKFLTTAVINELRNRINDGEEL